MAVPVLTTQAITIFGSDSGQGGGNVTSNGGKALSSKGICWNTTGTPTTADSKYEILGTSIGVFPATAFPLVAGTLYYVRAYAINADGTAYGSQISFTTLVIETPSLQNAWFENSGELTPIPQKPNLQNVWFEWRDPDYYAPIANGVNPIFMFSGF